MRTTRKEQKQMVALSENSFILPNFKPLMLVETNDVEEKPTKES